MASGEFAADALRVIFVSGGYRVTDKPRRAQAARVANEVKVAKAPKAAKKAGRLTILEGALASHLGGKPARKAGGKKAAKAEVATAPIEAWPIETAPAVVEAAPAVATGIDEAAAQAVIEANARIAAKAAKPAPAPVAPTADHLRLLGALIDCKALAATPIEARAGVWVRSAAVHDSQTPHNLDMRRVPALMGGLKRLGLVECGWDKAATVRLTEAGLTAALGR